ncbi:MAG: SCO1664 family protein [Chloroflexi bacterium]|nr:SCO1664 family protein [Chloroflexota bacterium]
MSEISLERALKLLREGELKEAKGYLPWGSNYTVLSDITDGELEALAVYKPRRGERPLWDFPDGTLCMREVAAYLISENMGWHIVPPTVLRDGPYGIGMVQLFVPHDPDENYFTFGEKPRYKGQLRRIALFDHIVNNADRKGGHCLLDQQGMVWAIDHGICFHVQNKLRTVIWEFAGEPIPTALLDEVHQLCARLDSRSEFACQIEELLSRSEVAALKRRINRLVETGTYPRPSGGRSYPWPPV